VTVTCLGCGCGCDDLEVGVRAGRIESLTPACPLAQRWFGTGEVPDKVMVDGRLGSAKDAVDAAADLLAAAGGRVLVVLAPDLTVRAQRAAIAIADLLRATVDTATSGAAADGILAAQRRGRAAATLGEIRHRADVVLCWAVDPSERYPRYFERYALAPAGTHVPGGRSRRALISVSVGDDRGPGNADLEASWSPDEEGEALSVMRAMAQGAVLGELPERMQPAARIAARMLEARYVAVVHDGEAGREPRSPLRAERLIALAQTLNHSTRAALSTLRAGGNRSGAESVLTWQTGFPMAVDFSQGSPRYDPRRRGLDRAGSGDFDAVLVAGTVAELGPLAKALKGSPLVLIGPRASAAKMEARVVIDTGMAGVHEAGTAYRMDDVPLPLTPPLPARRSAADSLEALATALRERGSR
jgi:formylmethanofuran dehydrogenase subunit B